MIHSNQAYENNLVIKCYDKIQDLIVEGAFVPGQKLKIQELKERFNVGQSPIREALSRLINSGLVEAFENKGFRVAQISEEEILDIYRTYTQIELLALKQAMELGDDAWEASIVAALHHLSLAETKSATIDYATWSERNYAFHVALISGCLSPLLMQIRADIYRRFDRYCQLAFRQTKNRLDANHEEHKQIAEAVLKRDLKTVTGLITQHINGSFYEVVQTLKTHKCI